jgi:ribosomal protein S18 acetylase RimI-like enzyme
MEFTREVGPHEHSLITLAAAASAPYDAFVYDEPAQIVEVHRVLYGKSASEYGPPHALLLVEEARLVGVNATMTAEELAGCRLRAARALGRVPWLTSDSPVRRRMRLASSTLMRNHPGDVHCTRQAVVSDARGSGYGRLLWQQIETEAIRAGVRRLTCEISPDHAPAVRLQEGLGFERVGHGETTDPTSGRTLTYLHMAKRLRRS